MAKSNSQKVPKKMQSKFEEITKLTDTFCSHRRRIAPIREGVR